MDWEKVNTIDTIQDWRNILNPTQVDGETEIHLVLTLDTAGQSYLTIGRQIFKDGSNVDVGSAVQFNLTEDEARRILAANTRV